MGTLPSYSSLPATATAYGSQRKVDRCQNGVLWAATNPATASSTAAATSYSTDGGNTWTFAGTFGNGSTSASGSYTPDVSFFIDLDDYAHIVFKDSGNGYLYYTRGTPNTARTAYTWSSPVSIFGSSTAYDYPDVVAFRDPATSGAWVAHVVANFTQSTSQIGTFYALIRVSAAAAISVASTSQIGGIYAGGNSNQYTYPSIDFRHTGDAKTAATVSGAAQPDLFMAWSAGATGSGYGIRFKKATYSNGAWTMGTEREIDNTRYVSPATGTTFWLLCMFDGTRAILAGMVYSGSSYDHIIHDRDAADTTTTLHTFTPPSYFSGGAAGYTATSDVVFLGRGSSGSNGSRTLAWATWSRASQTLGALTTISTTAPDAPWTSTRRGNVGQALDYVYTSGTASPYTVISGRISLNQPPTAPTVTAPANGATLDTANPLTLTITPQDPDGDNATAWDVRYRATGTTAPYTVVSGPFSPTVANNTSTTLQVLAANTWGGKLDVQVRTYDTSNTAGTWSTTVAVTGLPQALASQTGGQGGTAVPAMNLYAVTQAERALRAAGLV